MDEPTNHSTLLTTHVVSAIREHSPNPQAFLETIRQEAERFYCYPDGSILAEGGDSFQWFWNQVTGAGIMDWGIWQPQAFDGLDRFPGEPRTYMVFYTQSYRESLGELDLSIACPAMWAYPSKDYDLRNLLISVGFKRSASAKTQRAFSQMMERWFASVSEKGVFGDGPVRLVSPGVQFNQRLAQFRLDASSSGQNTLNWLLLSVLNFGYAVSLVSDFIFDQEKHLGVFLGPLSEFS